ncbi:MAG: glycosyltransferase family 2 protein [Opitutaceae bacterium]
MTKLSIITPCRNPGFALVECIESVARQIQPGIEYIVMDAASTDGTVPQLKLLAEKYPWLKWVSERDTGQSNAINKAIALARGEFIGVLNADDYYCPDVLPKVLARLAECGSNPVFLYGDLITVKIGENKSGVQSFPNLHPLDPFIFRYPFNPACYFYSKKLHEIVGPYDEADHLTMDLDFLIRGLPHAEIVYLPLQLGAFVMHAESKTQIDMDAGKSEARKQALVRRHLDAASFSLRTRLLIFRLKRHFGYLKWKLLNPR